MKVGYYPGCSLHGSANEYETSLQAIMDELNVELIEIEDWNCCGASAAHALNHKLGIGLSARNLALAAKNNLTEILVPCAACYIRLKSAMMEIQKGETQKKAVEQLIGRELPSQIKIFNIIEFLKEKRFAEIQTKIKQKLYRINVACYYGCLLIRPPEVAGTENWENPQLMEEIVGITEANPIEWPYKIECCGGGFTLSKTQAVTDLIKKIILNARANQADVILTACPMCHSNLDMRQLKIQHAPDFPEKMPILYITEFLGLAMGKPPLRLGIKNHFISARHFLEKIAGTVRNRKHEQLNIKG